MELDPLGLVGAGKLSSRAGRNTDVFLLDPPCELYRTLKGQPRVIQPNWTVPCKTFREPGFARLRDNIVNLALKTQFIMEL